MNGTFTYPAKVADSFRALALAVIDNGPVAFDDGAYWSMTWNGELLKVCPLLGLSAEQVIHEFWALYWQSQGAETVQ